jgi:hypothetical protein
VDLNDSFPEIVVIHAAWLTVDEHLVLAQRATKSGGEFAPVRFSPSCKEQWDPFQECYPHQTVIRCLSDEFNLDYAHGISINSPDIQLVALGREWGMYWNTALIYVIALSCTSNDVLDCWRRWPKDKDEHIAVGVMPVEKKEHRMAVIDFIRTIKVQPDELMKRCGAKWAEKPDDHELHDQTARARNLFALAHRFGIGALHDDS